MRRALFRLLVACCFCAGTAAAQQIPRSIEELGEIGPKAPLRCQLPRGVLLDPCLELRFLPEPIYPVLHAGQTKLAVRIIYQSSFDAPVSITAELATSARGWLRVSVGPGEGEHDEGNQWTERLSTEDIGYLYSLASSSEIWQPEQDQKSNCIDPTSWVIEALDSGSHAVALRRCGPRREEEVLLGLALWRIAQKRVPAARLNDNPGLTLFKS